MENKKINIEQFKALALSVQTVNKTSKDLATDKGNKQNELGFSTLAVLIHGNNTETMEVLRMFSKEGQFYDLRTMLSKARAILKELNEKGEIVVKTKTESVVYSFDVVKQWSFGNVPVFNVSTAYNSLAKKDNSPNQEEKALAAYLEQENMTKADYKAMVELRPGFAQEAIAQGQLILADAEKALALQSVPALVNALRHDFATLKALDDNAAYELIQSLIGDYQAPAAIAA